MSMWLDGRDDLHFWQHRHPDPTMRRIGVLMMCVGALEAFIGILVVTR